MYENQKLLNYREAASLLGMNLNTLYSLVYRRGIPHKRLSGRIVRFSQPELVKWLEGCTVSCKEGGVSECLPTSQK